MIKQNYITIKELEGKLEKSDQSDLINYIKNAIRHMEKMNANENDIINGNNMSIERRFMSLKSSDEQKRYDVEVSNNEVVLYNYGEDSWTPINGHYSCNHENERELLAKAVILRFLLSALSDKGIAKIDQIYLKDALGTENMTDFEKRIEELASRLIIPQSVFSDELGHDIAKLLYDEGRGEKSLIGFELERNILLAKLQSYGANEKMARVRLKNAVFDGKYDSYTERPYLNKFTYYYDDMHNEKDPVKNKEKR